MAAVAEASDTCSHEPMSQRVYPYIFILLIFHITFQILQSLEKQLVEAQKDLSYLKLQRKAAEEEEDQLRQDLAELNLERDRIDVRIHFG